MNKQEFYTEIVSSDSESYDVHTCAEMVFLQEKALRWAIAIVNTNRGTRKLVKFNIKSSSWKEALEIAKATISKLNYNPGVYLEVFNNYETHKFDPNTFVKLS